MDIYAIVTNLWVKCAITVKKVFGEASQIFRWLNLEASRAIHSKALLATYVHCMSATNKRKNLSHK